jgi:Domain of unknown function (DUF4417)
MLPASDNAQLWALKDQSSGQPMLGCGSCLDRKLCGGLQVTPGGAAAMDCMSLCRCTDPEKCDVVCTAAPKRFLRRVREVDGLDFSVIPVARPHRLPKLPSMVTLVEGDAVKEGIARVPHHVAVPLSMAVTDSGKLTRAKTKAELQNTFGIVPGDGWILTGVERDSYVERMWRMPSPRKVYEGMHKAGVVFATTPNFSTIADVPRHDNLHAMMRIAWSWFEMVEAGLPTALHINGRTDFDFVRWADFAKRQQNLKAIAFEFLTGAEPKADGQRYVERLKLFVRESGRDDLLLVLRGGLQWLPELRPYFGQTLAIDSGAYFKTVYRQRLVVASDGRTKYQSHKTKNASEMRALFHHNLRSKLDLHAGGTQARHVQPELGFDAKPEAVPQTQAVDVDSSQMALPF